MGEGGKVPIGSSHKQSNQATATSSTTHLGYTWASEGSTLGRSKSKVEVSRDMENGYDVMDPTAAVCREHKNGRQTPGLPGRVWGSISLGADAGTVCQSI